MGAEGYAMPWRGCAHMSGVAVKSQDVIPAIKSEDMKTIKTLDLVLGPICTGSPFIHVRQS